MDMMVLGIMTFERLEQSANAESPILFTPPGSVMLVNDVQSLNAHAPI